MGFAEEFIQGFTTGQQSKFAKENQNFNLWQQEVEKQDRDIHKQVLQHQLKQIKINEAIAARNAIKENLAQMEGTDVLQATPDQLEGGVLPSVNPITGVSNARFAPITLPGIDELGVPETQVRPKTLQDVLAEKIKTAKGIADTTYHEVSPGANLYQGPNLVGSAPARPAAQEYVWYTGVKNGKPFREYITKEEAAARGPAEQYRAPAGGGSGANALTQDELSINADAIARGEASAIIPVTTQGLKLQAAVKKRHPEFNLKKAATDEKSTAAYLRANASRAPEIINAADDLDQALTDLEAINNKWDRATFGPFNLSTIFGGGTKEAKDAQAAITNVKTALRTLRGAGSTATNAVLKGIEETLSASQSKTDLANTIANLRREGSIRINSIRNSNNGSSFGNIGTQFKAGDDPAGLGL